MHNQAAGRRVYTDWYICEILLIAFMRVGQKHYDYTTFGEDT